MIVNEAINKLMISPVRTIDGVVELYNSATFLDRYTKNGDLKSFKIERTGEEKFFGYGVAHKANIKVRDVNRTHLPKAGNDLKISFAGSILFPDLHITEVRRDELTNELSITAYDKLEQAAKREYRELSMAESYTINDLLTKIVALLELKGIEKINVNEASFNTTYKVSFEERENLREILNDVAEATQTIYYINKDNKLVFKTLNKTSSPLFTIGKEKYFDLKARDNKRLQTICKATEAGDNVSKSTTQIGSTQYVRDNGFWELSDNVPELLDRAIAAVGDLTIGQFEVQWRGNPLIEIGDKINVVTKDNKTLTSFLLNDTLEYTGALLQNSEWNFSAQEETESNPSTIGDLINQTYARVDKQNKTIELVAKNSETAVKKSETAITTATAADGKATEAGEKADAASTKADGADKKADSAITTSTETKKELAALKVTTNEISGTVSSHTTTITEVSGKVNSVEKTANSASTAASKAETDASSALTKAGTAETNASSALTKASTAESNAGKAVTTANAADGKADTAKTDAKAAKDKAEANETAIGEVEKKATDADIKAGTATNEASRANQEIEGINKKIEPIDGKFKDVNDTLREHNTKIEDNKKAQDKKNTEIESRISTAEAKLTDKELKLKFNEVIENTNFEGKITSITTSSDYTFNESGLTIGKSTENTETIITNNGMKVSEKGNVVLTANAAGVEAVNLDASTYLIIGDNSRFENYGSDRTGCFFIGGNK